jgi:glutaminase
VLQQHLFSLSIFIIFPQKIIGAFPFHHFDNVKQPAASKTDPCRPLVDQRSETVVALLFSAATGDATAMRRFFMSGMDMTVCDYDKRTALHLAAAEGHSECVEFLVKECGVDPNAKDRCSIV